MVFPLNKNFAKIKFATPETWARFRQFSCHFSFFKTKSREIKHSRNVLISISRKFRGPPPYRGQAFALTLPGAPLLSRAPQTLQRAVPADPCMNILFFSVFSKIFIRLRYSDPETVLRIPWHFGTDPDPRIHASAQWIRIRIRIRMRIRIRILEPTKTNF